MPSRQRTQTRRRAFSLFELTFVLLVLGIIAAALVPAIGNNIRSSRLRTAANVLAADIDYCASVCISRPGSLAAVTFGSNKYTLIDRGSSATLKHPMDNQDYINDFSTGRNANYADVVLSSVLSNGNPVTALTFDAYGKPDLTADLVITLIYKSQSLTVIIKYETGDVTISG
jgi:Tfp pilus assembly protein FimT